MTAAPTLVMDIIERMRLKRKRPEISQQQLLEKLSRLSIPRFVKMLRDGNYGSEVEMP
jgi:hypothetical protein